MKWKSILARRILVLPLLLILVLYGCSVEKPTSTPTPGIPVPTPTAGIPVPTPTAGIPVTAPTPEHQNYLPYIFNQQGPVEQAGSTYYVSKLGTNADGKTWQTAWNELDQIRWDTLAPGDTILLDGGAQEMRYQTILTVGKGGSESLPVTLKLASEAGRNGKAVIFGGRSTPLPYCGQKGYTYQTAGVRGSGIRVQAVSWVVIDGTKWRGITIYGHSSDGISLDPGAAQIKLQNLEVYDNGMANQRDGAWYPTLPGVRLAGKNITFSRVIIHDNGQDAIQSRSGSNNIANLVISDSWLYNGRKHPTQPESFNDCAHTDGLQIYDSGTVQGVTIQNSFIGPGFTQGIFLGEVNLDGSIRTRVNDVRLQDVVFSKASGIGFGSKPGVPVTGWVIDHVTAYCPDGYTGVCLSLEGSGNQVTNSIFVGSQFLLPDGLAKYTENCQWQTEGFTLGKVADPLFASANSQQPLAVDNYALLPSSPCAGWGSRLTSVDQLLAK